MKTEQYVYLGIWSKTLTPAHIATVIGLEPDTASLKGSRRLDPPVPVHHHWAVECRDPGVRITVQLERLMRRLRPHSGGLRQIAADQRVSVGLQMVRYFNSAAGQDDILGWHLDRDVLEFLVSIRAGIDSDEYDFDEC